MLSKELIPFLMTGYPNLESSEQIAVDLLKRGVRTIEIGVPFSDPMADGPVIQHAAEQALKNGVRLSDCLAMVSRIKKQYPQARLILFTYLNPLLRYGLQNYARDAQIAGVAATLTVDLPLEEATEYLNVHRENKLGTVFLASPTTSTTRLQKISEASSEFIYYVSRAGVTGAQKDLSISLGSELEKIKSQVSRKIDRKSVV